MKIVCALFPGLDVWCLGLKKGGRRGDLAGRSGFRGWLSRRWWRRVCTTWNLAFSGVVSGVSSPSTHLTSHLTRPELCLPRTEPSFELFTMQRRLNEAVQALASERVLRAQAERDARARYQHDSAPPPPTDRHAHLADSHGQPRYGRDPDDFGDPDLEEGKSDHRMPPILQVTFPGSRGATRPQSSASTAPIEHPTPPAAAPSHAPASTELLLASGIQADEYMARLGQEYKTCPYFADVLTALGSQGAPSDDMEMRRKQCAKRAKQLTLEDDGLTHRFVLF